MAKDCCEKFSKAVADKLIAHDGKGWHVNGCCGQCFVLSAIAFCPFCATALPERRRATPGAGKTVIIDGKRKTQKERLKNQPAFNYDTENSE